MHHLIFSNLHMTKKEGGRLQLFIVTLETQISKLCNASGKKFLIY